MEVAVLVLCGISLILMLLNVFQFFFWSNQNQKLVDKLMSRNFVEYSQVINPPPPAQKFNEPIDHEMAIQDFRTMQEIRNF